MLRKIRHGNDWLFIKNFYKPTCLVEFSLSSCLWTSGSLNLPLFFSSLIPCLCFFPLLPTGSNSFVSLDFLLPPFSISRCVLKTFFKKSHTFCKFQFPLTSWRNFLRIDRKEKENFLELIERTHQNPRIFSFLWKCFLLEPAPQKYGCIFLNTWKPVRIYLIIFNPKLIASCLAKVVREVLSGAHCGRGRS